MKKITIGFQSKRHAMLFMGVLISLRKSNFKNIRFGKLDKLHYLEFPESEINWAALRGFLSGRGGWYMGGNYPEQAESYLKPPPRKSMKRVKR